jgi:5-methylcytosine-specific restriction endonuclease McrA
MEDLNYNRNKGMGNFNQFLSIRGVGFNPRGTRSLTKREKEQVKKKCKNRCAKTGKKFKSRDLEVDHKKAVALSKGPWYEEMFSFGTMTKSGKPRKHSYDWKNNLQPLSKKAHKIKTKSDIKKIKEKRRKELEKWVGNINFNLH